MGSFVFRWLAVRVVVVAVVIVWAFAGGPLIAPVMWAGFAYLVWRAGPAVAADLGRLGLGRLFGRRGRRFPRAGGVL